MSPTAKNDTREWLKIVIGAAAVISGIFYAGKVDEKVDTVVQDVRDIKAYIYPTHLPESQLIQNARTAEHIKNVVVK